MRALERVRRGRRLLALHPNLALTGAVDSADSSFGENHRDMPWR